MWFAIQNIIPGENGGFASQNSPPLSVSLSVSPSPSNLQSKKRPTDPKCQSRSGKAEANRGKVALNGDAKPSNQNCCDPLVFPCEKCD
mmetsp:Transcript_15114/g.38085  ORF Transcript_15114/g.38085 Transcript_15114/m.38085 type:complete len:88 (-) Transcript_15114:939-1202(-)